jgi:probable rRNA maturation factor
VAEHDVLVSIEEESAREVTPDLLAGIARIALDQTEVGPCVLSILVTGDEQVQELNRRYAGDDHATDVLSFSLEEGEAFAAPPDGLRRLGEVVISCDTARRQAQAAGHFLEDELAHLLVHGILHLLGYDHGEDVTEREMRAVEQSILAAAGAEPHHA